eukprot:PhF_6_TR21929/c1_g1_i2/m.31155
MLRYRCSLGRVNPFSSIESQRGSSTPWEICWLEAWSPNSKRWVCFCPLAGFFDLTRHFGSLCESSISDQEDVGMVCAFDIHGIVSDVTSKYCHNLSKHPTHIAETSTRDKPSIVVVIKTVKRIWNCLTMGSTLTPLERIDVFEKLRNTEDIDVLNKDCINIHTAFRSDDVQSPQLLNDAETHFPTFQRIIHDFEATCAHIESTTDDNDDPAILHSHFGEVQHISTCVHQIVVAPTSSSSRLGEKDFTRCITLLKRTFLWPIQQWTPVWSILCEFARRSYVGVEAMEKLHVIHNMEACLLAGSGEDERTTPKS